MPRLKYYDGLGDIRFVTFSTYQKRKTLSDHNAWSDFCAALELVRATCDMRIYGYVLMTDHVHLLIQMPDTAKLGTVIGDLKRKSARAINRLPTLTESLCGPIWQKRCLDRNCRSREEAMEKLGYIHNNPVRAGLVADPISFRWGSYLWYLGYRDVPLVMDEMP